MLVFADATGRLFDQARNRCFEPPDRCWTPATTPVGGARLSAVAAATWLQRRSGHPLRQPIGVIGPREAAAEQLIAAESIGSMGNDSPLAALSVRPRLLAVDGGPTAT